MTNEREIKYLGDVQRLTLGPNDILVLSIDDHISHETALRIKASIREVLGEDIRVMILSKGMKVGVLAEAA